MYMYVYEDNCLIFSITILRITLGCVSFFCLLYQREYSMDPCEEYSLDLWESAPPGLNLRHSQFRFLRHFSFSDSLCSSFSSFESIQLGSHHRYLKDREEQRKDLV